MDNGTSKYAIERPEPTTIKEDPFLGIALGVKGVFFRIVNNNTAAATEGGVVNMESRDDTAD